MWGLFERSTPNRTSPQHGARRLPSGSTYITGGTATATTYLQKLRLFSRDVRLYLISAALVGFCWMGIYGVLLNLYLLRLGHGPEFVGLVNGAGFLAFAIFPVPAAALGRRWGSRRTMIAGISLAVAALALLPLADFIPTSLQAGWLLATYFLAFLGALLYLIMSNVFMMGATSPEERDHAFSMQIALWPLAGFAGSLVGGRLPGFFARILGVSLDGAAPYGYSLLIAAVLLIPALAVLLAIREGGAPETEEGVARSGPAPYRLMVVAALFNVLSLAGEYAARTFFNVYLDAGLRMSTSHIGLLVGVAQLVSVPAALAAPLVMARWGRLRSLLVGPIGIAISLLPLALIPHWGGAGLGYVGVVALSAITRVANNIFQMEIVSPPWRPAISGAGAMGAGLSGATVGLGGGYIVTTMGYPSLFSIGAGLTGAGALFLWAFFRGPGRELARGAAAANPGPPD